MSQHYMRDAIPLSIEKLWPDPNNPRLALPEPPGYADKGALFSEERRAQIFNELGDSVYNVDELVSAIINQGWMPIDAMIVWHHPDDGDEYVVVEGNRRRLALERIRVSELSRAREKLGRMKAKAATYTKEQIREQEEHLRRVEAVVRDTEKLTVVPIAASSVEELMEKLPRLLAVRHITGAKEWGNYAADLWLHARYQHRFEEKHPNKGFFWDSDIIKAVADEASLGATKVKWQLKSASWFGHFRAEWEDRLPEGEEFKKPDYYLFEQIAKKPWVRQQFSIGDDDSAIPSESEAVLFEWVFKLPRPKSAEDNPNKFFRHENITLWDQMRRYDEQHGTGFASRFDVERPEEAPRMHEVQAEWLTHKARIKPHAVLDDLLRRLTELTADQLLNEGEIFRKQLEQLQITAARYIKMIDSAEAA